VASQAGSCVDSHCGWRFGFNFVKGLEEAKCLLEKHREESVLNSADLHTFISQEFVERLGIEVVDQGEIKNVAWVARGVSLPIVGTAYLDLFLSTEQGTGVVLRKVKVFILPGKVLENFNCVFIGTHKLCTLVIHSSYQLRTTL
jgi:hypothetical protein